MLETAESVKKVSRGREILAARLGQQIGIPAISSCYTHQ